MSDIRYYDGWESARELVERVREYVERSWEVGEVPDAQAVRVLREMEGLLARVEAK